MNKALEIAPERAPVRLVEAELAAKGDDRRVRCVRPEQGAGRVAGDEPQEQERDDDHAQHHRDREQDPAHDIAQGGAGEDSWQGRAYAPRRAGAGRQVACEGGLGLVIAELGSAAWLSQTSSNRCAATGSRRRRATSVSKRSGGHDPSRATAFACCRRGVCGPPEVVGLRRPRRCSTRPRSAPCHAAS